MPNCRNDVFMSKVGINKINKQQELDFTVMENLPDCGSIRADKYIVGENTPKYTFNQYKKPANQFECERAGCINSGTLYTNGDAINYKAVWDATDYAAGVITFYVTGTGDSATVKVASDEAFTNADSYTIDLSTLVAGDDGFKAVVVDLSQTPTTTIGTGWSPSELGAYIQIQVTATGDSPDYSDTGISSINIFDSIEDFETSAVVKIACLTNIETTWDFEAAEATCFDNGGYNTDEFNGIEMTVTGKALTPNYMLLNPFAKKGTQTVGWDMVTVKKTVVANGDYGKIVLTDMSQEACGRLAIALDDNCNVTDAQLNLLSIPSVVAIDEKHFIAVNEGNGVTGIFFNKEHVGKEIVVSYPRIADIEEWVLSEENAGSVRTMLTYEKCQTDGVKYRFVYNNVLITSFPDSLSEDETEFEFSMTIQRDKDGRIGRVFRILD